MDSGGQFEQLTMDKGQWMMWDDGGSIKSEGRAVADKQ
jgi:hypothetical protein